MIILYLVLFYIQKIMCIYSLKGFYGGISAFSKVEKRFSIKINQTIKVKCWKRKKKSFDGWIPWN